MSPSSLTRSRPSEQGVDARGVLAFLDAVAQERMDLHSLMVLRHGTVVAEGWWAPYRAEDPQLLYSLSKTFTAMAVGLAVGEGRLSVEDLVADLLPDAVARPRPAHLDTLRVRHLLSMASGHRDDTILALGARRGDPVRGFLALAPDEPPGSIFAYNQGAPIALSAILTELTGDRLVDYLRPRLFDPLGIDHATWVPLSPSLDQGFSGLHVTTESVAKLGQLLLREGRWDGRQLVPASFVAACRRTQVDNARHSTEPDWRAGYGYLMWMCRHGAQRGDGAYGQLCVVLPDQDAVVVCTAELVDMQAELELVWRHLLPALSGELDGGSDAGDPGADEELAARLADLSTRRVVAGHRGPPEPVAFAPEPAAARHVHPVEHVRAEPLADGTRLVLRVAGEEHAFELRGDRWADGTLPTPYSPLSAAAATGGWTGPGELAVDVVSRRLPHRLRLRASSADGLAKISWRLPPLPIPHFSEP